jgi:hypothetical protein
VWGGRKKTRSLLAMSLILVLLGCSKVTLENYSRITVGMSYAEVTQLIGPPEKCDDMMGVCNCLWGNENGTSSVSLVADQALLFSSNNLKYVTS